MSYLACDVERKTYTSGLLIVRYMLSDKIKGKSALKARTFLHVVRDKVHACYWYRLSMHLSTENSAGYLQRVQIFLKPFIGEIFTYKGLFRRHDFVSLTKSYMILSCMIFLFRRHYNVMCDFFQQ